MFIQDKRREEKEESKKRKESLRKFDTLLRVDPTIDDEHTDEFIIPRGAEKFLDVEKGEQLSTHTRYAIIPRAIKRFDRFITVQVENYYECARNISYFSLFRGKGNGEIEDGEVCYKKKKCFKGRSIKKEPEWNLPKIDLNELKRYQFKGVQYDRGLADERGEVNVIPVESKKLVRMSKVKGGNQRNVDVIDEEGIWKINHMREMHFERGHLREFELKKYNAKGERNYTVVHDKSKMSMREEGHTVRIGIPEKGKFECAKCKKGFEEVGELAHHKLRMCGEESDDGGGEVKCPECEKVVEEGTHLIVHRFMDCEKKWKQYKCGLCDDTFVLKNIRDWHRAVVCRGKEKKFKCSVCDFAFFTEKGRNMHEENACFRTKGEKVAVRKTFNCRWCGGGFWEEEIRREHEQKHCYIVKKIKQVTGKEHISVEIVRKEGEGEVTEEEEKFEDAVEEQVEQVIVTADVHKSDVMFTPEASESEDDARKKIDELIKETEEEMPKGCNYFWGFE